MACVVVVVVDVVLLVFVVAVAGVWSRRTSARAPIGGSKTTVGVDCSVYTVN